VEISPKATTGELKALVMGDMLCRLVLVVPIPDEKATTVARVLLDRCIRLFGPPERLLTDSGPNFASGVIKELCRLGGVKKIITSPWHPKTDGTIERSNRTLCQDLSKFALREEDWADHVAMAAFRYNTSTHAATGKNPYESVFGCEAFGFDAGLGLVVN
jgi:transposase InsO family protein